MREIIADVFVILNYTDITKQTTFTRLF